MNETLRRILDLVVRNANGGKQVADDVRRLRVEATGSSRPLNDYERNLDRVGRQAQKSAADVAKLRREIQDTNRIVLTDKRGAITGVGGAAAQPGGSGGLLPAGLLSGAARGLGVSSGLIGLGVGGVAVAGAGLVGRFAFDQAGRINEARAVIDGLNKSLELIGISANAATRPLQALGLTAEQSSRAVLSLTNAGAKQDEILGAVSFSYDLARRRGIGFNEAVALVSATIRSGNERVAQEIGLKAKLSGANLTAEQQTRALADAISKQGEAYDAFKDKAAGVSGLILEIDTAQRKLGETFDETFADTAESIGRFQLALTKAANDLFRFVTDPRVQALSAFTGGPFGLLPTREPGDAGAGAVKGPFGNRPPIGPPAPSDLDLSQRRSARELREKLDPVAQRLVESLALEKLDGLAAIRGERDQTLGRLQGASPALLARIREALRSPRSTRVDRPARQARQRDAA